MREAVVERRTKETQIKLALNLDGGAYHVDTGCGFLNHMLELFAAHGGFGLQVQATGDVDVDYHHTVEDVGIVLGQALRQALGEMRGVARYGQQLLPMDEALLLAVVDVSGRAYLAYEAPMPAAKVGDFDTELVREFMYAFAQNARLTLHFKKLHGENSHHLIEAMFKGLGRALREAVSIEEAHRDEIPSSKGVL